MIIHVLSPAFAGRSSSHRIWTISSHRICYICRTESTGTVVGAQLLPQSTDNRLRCAHPHPLTSPALTFSLCYRMYNTRYCNMDSPFDCRHRVGNMSNLPQNHGASASAPLRLASRWIKLLWHCSSCREKICQCGSSCAIVKRTLSGAISASSDPACESLRQLLRHWMACPEVWMVRT